MRHKIPILYHTSELYLERIGMGVSRNSKNIIENEFAGRDLKPLANRAIEE